MNLPDPADPPICSPTMPERTVGDRVPVALTGWALAGNQVVSGGAGSIPSHKSEQQ